MTTFVLKSYIHSAAICGGICHPFCRAKVSMVSLYSANGDCLGDLSHLLATCTGPVIFTFLTCLNSTFNLSNALVLCIFLDDRR